MNIVLDIENKLLTIPLIKNISIRGYRNKKNFYDKIINVTLIKEAERYYACVLVKTDIKNKEYRPHKMIGIDIGLNNIIVTSDGEKYGSMWKTQEKLDNKLKL
jgi:transposase